MKRLVLLFTVLACGLLYSENYVIQGSQTSEIRYQLSQRVEVAGKTKSLSLSFVVPESFESPTFTQRVSNVDLKLVPEPSEKNQVKDKRGNVVIQAKWKNPASTIDASMSFTANNETHLKSMQSSAPFPLPNIPGELEDYLSDTKQVQVNNPQISAKAQELVAGVKTEFDAVQRILTWVVDNVRYVTPPKQYDALYSFQSGKGNCQNYSHLSAALMRRVGIPVRIVNGVTLKQPYVVKMPEGEFTFKMGQGRHSWIEVWFPDLGWVPFDPQQSELFVSNRYVRIEVGVDNNETINDGTVKWRQAKGVQGKPRFQEGIEASFAGDNVMLSMEKQTYGPKGMLLCPQVQTVFLKKETPKPPPPPKVTEKQMQILRYTKPYVFGNLDYPKGVDFFVTRGPAEQDQDDEFVMRKNFMVETAEYVTTKMTQYAQVFVLEKPMKLKAVSLAIHKFGGDGQIWLDLMEDNNGKPGATLATSRWMDLNNVPMKAGYDWMDFVYDSNITLKPGKYWIGLGFTGSPIMNWYYTYGKPIGPIDGTRYKGVYDAQWSGALAYEFNYRVVGWAAE